MVFGNRSVDSGTGVLFTRNPATGEPVLYGDVMFNAQGEDVVAGTHGRSRSPCLMNGCPRSVTSCTTMRPAWEHHHRDART